MKNNVSISWLNEMAFEAEVNDHKLYLDASAEHGGKNMGPRPKPLLLLALAGCTAMDVISVLKKMRVEVKSFDVEVEGDLMEEHPKKYSAMKVIYSFTGDVPRDKAEKAVNLSRERYCGVSAMFSEILEIDYEIKINE